MSAVELSAEQTYGEAARAVVAARTRSLFAHSTEKLLDPQRPEGVHKTRVATRRLRAALEIFGPALPSKRLEKALSEVKLLADALGERRDLDVQIELLESVRDQAGRGERPAIDDLIGELRQEQGQANEHLVQALQRANEVRLEHRLRRLAK